MDTLRNITFSAVVFALGIITLANISVFTVFADPMMDISPTCGPSDPGFNIIINANGFAPNSTVAVKFVTSDSKIVLYTQYDTNSTGGFNDVTFADDLKEGNYKLYLGDDTNSDGAIDIGAKRVYANVTIPCPS